MHYDLIIKDAKAILAHPKKTYQLIEEEVDIGVHRGKVKQIGSLFRAKAKSFFKAKGLYVLPGLIDTQVHFREPGHTHKETIASGSKACLLGGMSAFFDMPNTTPPTTELKQLNNKIRIAKKHSYCDFAFFLGATPKNVNLLPLLWNKARHCPGIKIFLGPSTGGLVLEGQDDLEFLFKNCRQNFSFHSEDKNRLKQREHFALESKGDVVAHTIWRDPKSATLSTKRILDLSLKHRKAVHVLHISTKEEIALFKNHLKKPNSKVSFEITPQHLCLSAPGCYKKWGTLVQMNPPIREKAHQESLWQAIQSNMLITMGSDHAPHTLEEKMKPYPLSPSGIPGTQTMLTLMLDQVNKKNLSLIRLTELLALNPSRIFKIKERGLIKEGFLANFSIVDLKKTQSIKKDWLASQSNWSPFEGKTTKGWPFGVILRGRWAMREEQLVNDDDPNLSPNKALGIEFL